MGRYRYSLLILWVALLTPLSWSQSTSVTATITDTPDGQTWNNGTGTATFVPGQPQNYHWTGGTIPNQVSFALNGSGTFTVSLPDNSLITPLGSAWLFSICPNASSPCVSKQITVTGPTLNLSTQLSSVAMSPRFPATPLAYGYLDQEISPLPVQGAFYWNVTGVKSRQWTGSVWQDFGGGGGGGGGTPSGPVNSLQGANAALNGFISDPNFLLDNTTHTMSTGGNIVNGVLPASGNLLVSGAMTSLPRQVYDPMDTKFDGGLAAAIAGTSGFTPTQVIQATLDYAECQLWNTAPTTPVQVLYGARVILPTGIGIPISQVLLWNYEELSGESETNHPSLQHTTSSLAMIAIHPGSDTLTCGGKTISPGGGNSVLVKNLAIAGTGTGVNDIGIDFACESCRVSHIAGFGNGFGGQAVLLRGTSVFADHLGYEGAQLKGCQVYITGAQPPSASPTGECGAVEDDVLDGEFDYAYVTDGAQFLSGHGPGPCYPKCAGFIFNGLNGHANKMFSQVSDIGIFLGGTNARFNDLRIDATSMEGLYINGGAHLINGVSILGPCTSNSLQSNYNAGIPTGCFPIHSPGSTGSNGGNVVSSVNAGAAAGILGPSFVQAWIEDGVQAGGTANKYIGAVPAANPANLGPNDWPILASTASGGPAAKVVLAPESSGTLSSGSTANISGVSLLFLNTSTPLSNVIGGHTGQIVTIYASAAQGNATINNNFDSSGLSPFGIVTCSGLPVTVTSVQGAVFQYSLNNMAELGCDTQTNFAHLNWNGNPIPSAPSIIDLYGNVQPRQNPVIAAPDFTNLHGSTSGGSACFAYEQVYSDGSHAVSAATCTNVNLAAQTPGSIFAPAVPRATLNLYLVSNAQGNGVPLGKYPPPFSGPGLPTFWDGPTVIASGGNGVQPTGGPGDNNTGEYWAPFGILLNTSITQPACAAEYRGLTWVVQGAGSTADSFQICERLSTGAYQWTAPSGGGGGGLTGSGTVNTIALWTGSTTNLGNSHITDNGTLLTATLPVQVNDSSGTNGLTLPEQNPITGAASTDTFWSDSGATSGVAGLMFNESNGGAKNIVGIKTIGVSGDSVKLDTNGKDIVDNGPDGSNFTPTKICDSGCGTGGTATLSSGANDNNGWLTIATGTSPAGGGAGVVTVTFGGSYAAARKCSVTPDNNNAYALGSNSLIVTSGNSTNSNFVITPANSAALAASTTYIVFYRCGK